MHKYCCLLLLVSLSCGWSAMAQQDTLTSLQEKERNVLAMSRADFRQYQNGIKEYGRQLTAIRQDTQMSDSAKAKAISELHAAIQTYQQQHLGADKMKRLKDFEQNNLKGGPSRFRQQMQEHEARMKKAGARMARDTLH